MILNNDKFEDDRDNHSKQEDNQQYETSREADNNNLQEENLERSFLFGADKHKPVMEGKAVGGQNFGKNNLTPAGDDKNNPSQNAGYTNPYFARTEPSEEHPEDSNFKVQNQDGRPDYKKAQPDRSIKDENPKPEKAERGYGKNDRPHVEEPYREGTADNENEPDLRRTNELPDQQRAGKNFSDDPDEREHIET